MAKNKQIKDLKKQELAKKAGKCYSGKQHLAHIQGAVTAHLHLANNVKKYISSKDDYSPTDIDNRMQTRTASITRMIDADVKIKKELFCDLIYARRTTIRGLAKRSGVSKTTVHKYWRFIENLAPGLYFTIERDAKEYDEFETRAFRFYEKQVKYLFGVEQIFSESEK